QHPLLVNANSSKPVPGYDPGHTLGTDNQEPHKEQYCLSKKKTAAPYGESKGQMKPLLRASTRCQQRVLSSLGVKQ
ncbi:hypothetical protein DSO57_1014461, partial [Entomophthora muscae]